MTDQATSGWHFAFTRDLDLIRPAVCHERIYDRTTDDLSPPRDQAVMPEICLYGTVWQGEEYGGVFGLVPHNSVLAELHTALLPCMWGDAAEIGRHFIAWVFETTQFRRLIGAIPEFNRLALRMAKLSGMTEYGVNPASFLKHGKLHSLIMVGVSKGQ